MPCQDRYDDQIYTRRNKYKKFWQRLVLNLRVPTMGCSAVR